VHASFLAVTVTDATVFSVSAAVIVAGAIGVIAARNPVHSALMLVMTLFGIAVLFVEQQSDFLAAVQVIVYAGAIVVLFLFVIMLLGVDKLERLQRDPLPGQRPLALVIGAAGLSLLLFLAGIHWVTGAHSLAGPASGAGSNVEKLARSIFTTYLLPFEVTSVLLVIAVVGAVVLARRPPKEPEPPAPSARLRQPEAGQDAGPAEPSPAARPDGEAGPEARPEVAEEPAGTGRPGASS
jgi:NADH-quinone oxidoreductase subunit J